MSSANNLPNLPFTDLYHSVRDYSNEMATRQQIERTSSEVHTDMMKAIDSPNNKLAQVMVLLACPEIHFTANINYNLYNVHTHRTSPVPCNTVLYMHYLVLTFAIPYYLLP